MHPASVGLRTPSEGSAAPLTPRGSRSACSVDLEGPAESVDSESAGWLYIVKPLSLTATPSNYLRLDNCLGTPVTVIASESAPALQLVNLFLLLPDTLNNWHSRLLADSPVDVASSKASNWDQLKSWLPCWSRRKIIHLTKMCWGESLACGDLAEVFLLFQKMDTGFPSGNTWPLLTASPLKEINWQGQVANAFKKNIPQNPFLLTHLSRGGQGGTS